MSSAIRMRGMKRYEKKAGKLVIWKTPILRHVESLTFVLTVSSSQFFTHET